MAEPSEKLRLGENHRRVVSAVVRRIEKTCDEVLAWLDRRPGLLHQFRNDITPEKADQLRVLVAGLREEMARFHREVTISPAVQSRARAVAGTVSFARTEIEEVMTPGLRGYGPIAPDAEAALDLRFTRFLACLEAMSDIVESPAPQGES